MAIRALKRVLIPGAAGDVGSHLRRELAGRYRLRLADVRPITGAARGDEIERADITRMADALAVTKGVDAIVHLAGFAVEGPWETILASNIEGTYNLRGAARRKGVKRVPFATSNPAVAFYRRNEPTDHRVYPRPDSRYGVSKVFGEALASLYADKYGVQSLCMRIGNVNPKPVDKRRLSIWISPRDLAQLVGIGIEHPDIRFEIVYGVSGNRRSWYDNANAVRLGYRPQDHSEYLAGEVLRDEKPGADPIVERYQGGAFVLAEIGGDPKRPVPRGGKGRRCAKTREKARRGQGRSPGGSESGRREAGA